MLEKKIVQEIRSYLLDKGATCHKYHGGAYAETGHSDLYGTLKGGRAYFIEVKQPGKKPTPTQLNFLEREEENGALCMWTDSLEMVKDEIK